MNDYSFGNFIYEERKKRGLSQRQLADLLDVSNKAVSKWENGRAKPTTETLRQLAVLFGISVEELLKVRTGSKPKTITTIVITGGPCAGKTTGLSWIQNAFSSRGYRVLFVPETATELISGGIDPKAINKAVEFQKCLMSLQLSKEAVFRQAAEQMPEEKILIVCDRGAMDNKAYMSEMEFQTVLSELQLDPVALRDSYDGVFHLVTAAKGAEKFYTLANNQARTESPAQARELDDKLIAAWTGHPHLRVIGNESDFEGKMKKLVAEIASLLGEPEPLEIERKYLIAYPDLSWLESLPNCHRVEILQTYLQSDGEEEVRVRQRGENGSFVYYETRKRNLTGIRRVEIERRLTEREYLARIIDADPKLRPIRKTRYCLTWEGQYFEIDVYPFWEDKAIVEIELKEETDAVRFPKKIHVLREVTDDPAYKNAALAAGVPQ